jgi:hypothetical protein
MIDYSIVKKIIAKERYQGYNNAYLFGVDRFAG